LLEKGIARFMTTDSTAFAELLYMASIYRERQHFDLSKKLLQDLIDTLLQAVPKDYKSLSIVKYYLAEIYADEKNYPLAQLLYKRAAKNFDKFKLAEDYAPGSPALLAALTSLELESQRLIHRGRQKFKPRKTA
jgi:hypothetical protein